MTVERWEHDVSRKYGRLVVLCGPVLNDDDKVFRDKEVGDDGFVSVATFRVPQAFWKIVLTLDETRTMVARSFLFPNYDPGDQDIDVTRNVEDYAIQIEELAELLPAIRFPTEVLSPKLLPLK